MGGRGSLSQRVHKMYNTDSIRKEMRKMGVRIVGLENVAKNRQGLSLVVEVLETVQELQKTYGKHIDSVVVGLDRSSTLSYKDNLQVKSKKGEVKNLGRTLIIPKQTLKKGKSKQNQEIKKANKKKVTVSQNIKQAVMHEYGHALHLSLKRHDSQSYARLEKQFQAKLKVPDSRIYLSEYAKSKAYKGKISSHEYVAESIVHLMRNTRTRKGKDMLDLVRSEISKVPGVKFPEYVKPTPIRKIQRKRKK